MTTMTRDELCKFICDLFNCENCNAMILRQINKMTREQGYSYLDIARSLSYYSDIKNMPLQIQYGIGIVPCIIDEARKYYKGLEIQKAQQIAAAKKSSQKKERTITCVLDTASTIKRPKIDLDEIE